MATYTEQHLRNYLRCPRRFSYNNVEELATVELTMLEQVFNRITSLYMKRGDYDLDLLHNDTIVILNRKHKEKRWLTSQYRQLLNQMNVYAFEMFTRFNILEYSPLFGPFIFSKQFGDTTIDIKVNGIFKGKNQTLHIVIFSPYQNELSVLSDPIVHWVSEHFSKFIVDHPLYNRPTSIIHVFYIRKNNELNHINFFPKKKVNTAYDGIVQGMEAASYYPRLPCTIKCGYKARCKSESYDL